jgi:hypothetical protein
LLTSITTKYKESIEKGLKTPFSSHRSPVRPGTSVAKYLMLFFVTDRIKVEGAACKTSDARQRETIPLPAL